MYDPHTVTFTMTGPEDIVHPNPDADPCGFVAYLETWADAMPYWLGPWQFTWIVDPEQEAGGYWNGTQLP